MKIQRCADIKIADAIKYIDSLPWEGQEFDDRTPLETLRESILKCEWYDDFHPDDKNVAEWLEKSRVKEKEEVLLRIIDEIDEVLRGEGD